MRYCRKGIHFHVLRFKEGSFMISFIVCLALLITGYLTYGKIVDNTFTGNGLYLKEIRYE